MGCILTNMTKIEYSKSKDIIRVNINSHKPVINFNFKEKNSKSLNTNGIKIKNQKFEINETDEYIEITKDLGIKEHILGLGEKTFDLDKRRTNLMMWNTDSYAYTRYSDPLYVSIPFFITASKNEQFGVFINNTGKTIFDIGIENYGKLKIKVYAKSTEFFIIDGKNIKEIIRNFVSLTGKPFKIPKWALGHSISRYSYFPQEKVLDVLREYKRYTDVDTVYLDIDYMKDYKIFEWNKDYFPNPKSMINEIHKIGTKIVTIIDPAIVADQKDKVFLSGLGKYCEYGRNQIYTADMWAGKCVFPDFLNKKTREWWSNSIKNWIKNYKIDGIWLDMNEPAAFTKNKTFDDNVVHKIDDKNTVKHSLVHNAYAYFEAEATYKGMKNGFILSRAGYAGIQKYAAIWSGDSVSSWEDMKIQIPLLLSLSISGVPYVGCDIGGFVGRSDPELLARYYQMSAFFPIFRNHKNKDGNDQELYNMNEKQRERILNAIKVRYLFMDYIKELADKAHETGDPIIRPLFYEFEDDENTYTINDEYMVGGHLLFAPIIEKNANEREVYLPAGKWVEFNTKKEFHGPVYMKSKEEMPIFIKEGADISLTDGKRVKY